MANSYTISDGPHRGTYPAFVACNGQAYTATYTINQPIIPPATTSAGPVDLTGYTLTLDTITASGNRGDLTASTTPGGAATADIATFSLDSGATVTARDSSAFIISASAGTVGVYIDADTIFSGVDPLALGEGLSAFALGTLSVSDGATTRPTITPYKFLVELRYAPETP